MDTQTHPADPAVVVEGTIHPSNQALYNDANENRSLTAGLGATVIAVLTFALIFLYDRANAGQINDLLFQGTILIIVVSLTLISLSSLNYWFVMEAFRNAPARAKIYQQRADSLFAASLILLLLEPSMILITVKLYVVGGIALALWAVGMIVLVLGFRELR